MPRSTGGFAFALAVALFIPDHASALEEGGGAAKGNQGYDHVDFSVDGAAEAVAGIKGQDHVDFSVEGPDGLAGDSKGDGHVHFAVDGAADEAADVVGQDHVDFCVDPGGAYAIEAELLPGENGAEICCDGERGSGHVQFRIVVRADGGVEVNGERVAGCDPAEGCRVSLGWCPGTDAMVVQVTDATGIALAAQYAMAGAPEEVRVAAAEVRALSVVRQ